MEFTGSGLHDYSTFGGKLKLFLNRLVDWSWLLIPLGFVGALIFGMIMLSGSGSYLELIDPKSATTVKPVLLGRSPSRLMRTRTSSAEELMNLPLPNMTSPGDASNLKNGTFLFRPLQNVDVLKLYKGLYIGLTEIQKIYLRKLEIRDIIIDAALLSERLRDSPNLETIILENVAISGNFSRVFLPKLKEFTYIQHRNSKTDFYKEEHVLKSILFFDLVEGQSWDLKKDVLNLGVKIKLMIGGTTLLEVDRQKGLVTLNVKICEDIYSNFKPGNDPLLALSLGWCTIKDASKIPLSNLKYLNLNTAVPDKPILSEIIRGATELESFHAFLPFACDNASWISPDIPEIMIFTNLTDFSDTIRTVSISKLAIYSLPENFISPITNLTLETVNVTGILENFHKHFANLNRVAIFNSSSVDDGYKILQEILKTPAEWILMQQFSRDSGYSQIEKILKQAGISETEMDFILERNSTTGELQGRGITDFEKHFNRFNLLEFNDFDTYGDYSIWDAVYE